MRRGGAPKGKGERCSWKEGVCMEGGEGERERGRGGSAHVSKKSGRKDVRRILISIL